MDGWTMDMPFILLLRRPCGRFHFIAANLVSSLCLFLYSFFLLFWASFWRNKDWRLFDCINCIKNVWQRVSGLLRLPGESTRGKERRIEGGRVGLDRSYKICDMHCRYLYTSQLSNSLCLQLQQRLTISAMIRPVITDMRMMTHRDVWWVTFDTVLGQSVINSLDFVVNRFT